MPRFRHTYVEGGAIAINWFSNLRPIAHEIYTSVVNFSKNLEFCLAT